jgi:septum site-determining protein MinC
MTEHRRASRPSDVRMRGTRDGIVIQLPADQSIANVLSQVRSNIDANGAFFRQGEVVIDFGARAPNIEEIHALRTLLYERGVRMRTVTAGGSASQEILRSWGFDPLRLSPGRDDTPDPPPPPPETERTALYVRRTLRSGSSVHSASDVIVLGDVNAGAEVLAGGDVIVWGALRGTVHAGISGDHDAIICALRLTPTQLRIGSIFARPPDEPGARPDVPMLVRVEEDSMVVEPWRFDRRLVR